MAESEQERLDRELIEMLNELRVALPGVQVLFAFLLTVPFSQRFGTFGADDRRTYFVAVLLTVQFPTVTPTFALLTAISAAFLIAPSAHHRMGFRERAKQALLKVGNVCTILGLAFLAGAVGASLYVVTKVLYDSTAAALVAGVVTGGTAVLWVLVTRFLPRD